MNLVQTLLIKSVTGCYSFSSVILYLVIVVSWFLLLAR